MIVEIGREISPLPPTWINSLYLVATLVLFYSPKREQKLAPHPYPHTLSRLNHSTPYHTHTSRIQHTWSESVKMQNTVLTHYTRPPTISLDQSSSGTSVYISYDDVSYCRDDGDANSLSKTYVKPAYVAPPWIMACGPPARFRNAPVSALPITAFHPSSAPPLHMITKL
mmetsp:Transcript_15564/g.33968  ORF Transcript_15564/g.33968 Transcript_15564/m.33968 type:complete len:169 (-) Transcript_15564:640-1146(-)